MTADGRGIVVQSTDLSAGSGGIDLIGHFIGDSEGSGVGVELVLAALETSGPVHIEGTIDRTGSSGLGSGVRMLGTTVTALGPGLDDAEPLVSIVGTVLSSASGVGVLLNADDRTPEGAEGPVTTRTRIESGPGSIQIAGTGSAEELAVQTSRTDLVTRTGTIEVRDESEGGVLLGTGTLVRKSADSLSAALRVISPVSIAVADAVEFRSDGGPLNLFLVGGDSGPGLGGTLTPGADVITIGSASFNTQGGNVTWLADSTSIGASASVRTQGGSVLVAGSVLDQAGTGTTFFASSIRANGVPLTNPILFDTQGANGAAGGSVEMFADDGLLLVGTQITVGSGRVDLAGNQRTNTAAAGLELRGVQITANGGGEVQLSGTQRSVSSPGLGIRIAAEGATRSSVATESGNVSIVGNVFPGKANPLAVDISQTDLQTSSGVIRIAGGDGSITGPGVPEPVPVAAIGDVMIGAGTVIRRAGAPGAASLQVRSGGLVTVDENVQISAEGGPLGVTLLANSIAIQAGVNILTSGGDVQLGQSTGVDGSGNPVVGPAASIRMNGRGEPDRIVINTAGGSVRMLASTDGIFADRTTIQTGSGDVTLNGTLVVNTTEGADPQAGSGVELVGVVVETTQGDVSITGRSPSLTAPRPGTLLTAFNNDGLLTRTRITTTGGSISVSGFSGNQTGVGSGSQTGVQITDSDLQTDAGSGDGDITVIGVAGAASQSSVGATLLGANLESTVGSVEIRGRASPSPSGSAGVRLDGGTVVAARGTGAKLVVAGNSGDTGGGANDLGLDLRAATIGGTDVTADVVLAALSSGNTQGIASQGTQLVTTGAVNLRPARVDQTGAVADEAGAAIQLGGEALPGTGLLISQTLLNLPQRGFSAMVVGSDQHVGRITVEAPLNPTFNLTLQNSGSGSGGIQIDQPIVMASGTTLALVSAGAVGQSDAGTITAPALVLRGVGTGAKLELTNIANSVRQLAACATGVGGTCGKGPSAYDGGGSIKYVGQAVMGPDPSKQGTTNAAGDLSPVQWRGFDRASDTSVAENVSQFGAGTAFSVKVLNGNLLLDPDVTTSNGVITLEAPNGVFNNFAGGQLVPGGDGHFVVIARTWVGETRNGVNGSGQFPNVYNCPGGTCTSSTGNSFVYTEQPNATVSFGTIVVPYGVQLDQLVIPQTSGLILGDSLAAIFGSSRGTFDPASLGLGQFPAPGQYSIGTSIASPAGYGVTVVPGLLVVVGRDAVTPGDYYPPDVTDATLPKMCTTTAPALTAYSTLPEGDYLDLDWSRSRQRLSLTSCTGLRLKDSCSDF